jgi:phosphatidylglycerophosphate synthase
MIERRPIASRDSALSRTIAGWLARRGVSPNAISLAGLASGVLAGAALFATQGESWSIAGFLAAAAFIQLRLLANMFDGMVAIEQQRTSPVGELYNEIPDRISDAATLIGAGYAAGGDAILGFTAACLALLIAYVRAQGKVAGAHQEFCGPMAKQQRMFVITIGALYAALAPASWQPGMSATGVRSTMALALGLIVAGGLVTVFRRLRRIARALRNSPFQTSS